MNWGFLRLMISNVANFIVSLIIGARITDYTSGMQRYSTNLVKNIINDLHSQIYEIQIEAIRQAHLRGFKIKEIPITFANRKKGKSKLTPNEVKGFISQILKSFLFRRKIQTNYYSQSP